MPTLFVFFIDRESYVLLQLDIITDLRFSGHFDILYQPEQIFSQPPPSQPIAVPTYLQSSLHHYEEPVMDLGMSDFMTMIPGMSLLSNQSNWMSNQFYGVSDYAAPTAAVPPPPVSAPAPIACSAPRTPTGRPRCHPSLCACHSNPLAHLDNRLHLLSCVSNYILQLRPA